MTRKTFVLGIGAPKAGTTWLYSYLSADSGFAKGFLKEFHIWDAVYSPEARRFLVREGQPILSPRELLRREMQKYPAAYFAYFANLVSDPAKTHTSDITPSYMSLSAEHLRFIHAGIVERGMDMKVVFLMRDPVERCWSMLRMIRSDTGLRGIHSYLDYSKTEDQLLRDYAESGNARIRTNYHMTLTALRDSGIPSDNIHVGFYESMFQPDRLRSLSAFLRLPYRPELVEKKVHVSPRDGVISEGTRIAVARHFAPVYRGVAAEYAEARDLWSGFNFIDDLPEHKAVRVH